MEVGIVLAALALFAIDVAVGIGLSGMRATEPRSGQEQAASRKAKDMTRKAKSTPRSLTDDVAALGGWWVQGPLSEGGISRLIRLHLGTSGGGTIKVYDLDTQFKPWQALVTIALEERGEDRLIMYMNWDHPEAREPAFKYRLSGDRLELEVQDTEWHAGEAIWNLSGQWYRLRLP